VPDLIDFLTVKETGEKWNASGFMVMIYCKEGVKRCNKKGNFWLVLIDTEKLVNVRIIHA